MKRCLPTFVALISIAASNTIQADTVKNYGTLVVSDVVKVRKADAFVANLDYVHPILAEEIVIKVAGIRVPRVKKSRCEQEKDLGLQAKSFTNNFLQKAKRIELRNVRRGKQFVIIADVYGDSISLAEELIRTHHAYALEPDKVKKGWCSK